MDDQPKPIQSPEQLMALLGEMASQSRHCRQLVPQAASGQLFWDGLAFSVAGVRMVASMKEIREMTPFPSQITRVPGAREWVKGLANVRGDLLPVVDLQQFFGANAVVRNKSARMLVVRMRGLECGLLVPSVQGIRHFSEELRVSNAQMKGSVGRFVYDAFSIDDEVWPVFSMSGLTADPEFRSAAA